MTMAALILVIEVWLMYIIGYNFMGTEKIFFNDFITFVL